MIQQTLFSLRPRDPDICRRKHGGADTSVLAHARVQKARDRDEVLNLMRRALIGATLDEIANMLGIAPNRISGRITELKKAGLIRDTGKRRKTVTDSWARVYEVML